MSQNLIRQRENAMDRADAAVNSAWPERTGESYVKEMQSVANELQNVAVSMENEGIGYMELSRTFRYLGSIYADLAPALGNSMYSKSKDHYLKAEKLLKGCDDDMEVARLNFNYANTLRQMDPNNIDQLQEAKARFLSAKETFTIHAPEYIDRVDKALWSVNSLLNIAPILETVENNYSDMEKLKKELDEGKDLKKIMEKMGEIMFRDGGVFGLIGKVKVQLENLPPEIKQGEKFKEISMKLGELTGMALEGATDPEEVEIIKKLSERLENDISKGIVQEDRADTLRGLLEQIKRQLANG
jgi:hypothetical protein